MLPPVPPESAAPVGRLAPSPTGPLHLGNAWAFLLAWMAARLEGGTVILRMEDIDPARCRREWAEAALEDLLWLGLDWDQGPDGAGGEKGPHGPYAQSRRTPLYETALASLRKNGHVYPCFCSRRELRGLAGAPHEIPGDAGAFYPGLCRLLPEEERAARIRAGRRFAWRLACSGGESFDDAALGPQFFRFAECGGDFALRRSDGVWAYQLTASVDDALMGVTQVVRGEDILPSTPRQLLLFRLLGRTPPRYAHVPLLHDSNGERLAKRHRSLSLRALREKGLRPETVTGRLAELAGFARPGEDLLPRELKDRIRREHASFPWKRLPRHRLTAPL